MLRASLFCFFCFQTYFYFFFFFFNDTATTEIYTLSLHDALPILFTVLPEIKDGQMTIPTRPGWGSSSRSEEHTSELQSLRHLVCRLLLEKKKKKIKKKTKKKKKKQNVVQENDRHKSTHNDNVNRQ